MDVCEVKIFDCFTFFNELEILELRLMELYDLVDFFVIAEANRTHAGNPKEFVFEKNKELYKDYLDKIIYVKVEDMPDYSVQDAWKPIYHQWNALSRGLEGVAKEGDWILNSDCDELPSIDAVKSRLDDSRRVGFYQPLFYYYVNCLVNQSWVGTIMAKYGTYHDMVQLRYWRRSRRNVCPDGGWHYSYFATPEQIFYKADNIAEREGVVYRAGTSEKVAERKKMLQDPYLRKGNRFKMKIIDISNNKPKHLDKWLEKYPQFFYKDD